MAVTPCRHVHPDAAHTEQSCYRRSPCTTSALSSAIAVHDAQRAGTQNPLLITLFYVPATQTPPKWHPPPSPCWLCTSRCAAALRRRVSYALPSSARSTCSLWHAKALPESRSRRSGHPSPPDRQRGARRRPPHAPVRGASKVTPAAGQSCNTPAAEFTD